MTDDGKSLKREDFTAAQLLQADNVGRVTAEHRRRRPTMRTHAIDNVTPEIIADRDDGIFVEVEPAAGKGYCAHVTIADVAAHVRPHSHLSNAAWQRAYTVYRPGGNDPMFPKTLEENLSLEHGLERLGLTVNITLDEHFKPIHTSFTPVVTKADNASYEQAQTRIADDPQFGLMAKIAAGIEHQCRTNNNAAWERVIEDLHQRSGLSNREIKTMDMVAAYMLLTNNCVAEFFNKSQLPFLYRNFDEANDAHASYSVKSLGHTAIESMGFQGAYCHVTSPIRRGPDYFNGAMMHYAVDVLSEIKEKMAFLYSTTESQKLEENLWKHGSEIIRLVTSAQPMDTRSRASLDSVLYTVAQESFPSQKQPMRRINIANRLQLPEMPYNQSELNAYAAHINGLAHSTEMVQVARLKKDEQKLTAYQESLKSLEGKDEEYMRSLAPGDFSKILHAAAIIGDMPENLFKETLLRIEDKSSHNTNDLFNVFIKAQYPTSERWRELKKAAAHQIKKNSGTVNALLPKLAQLIYPSQIHSLNDSIITHSDMEPGGKSSGGGEHNGAAPEIPSPKPEDPLSSLGKQGELGLAAPYASDTRKYPDRISRALMVIESPDGSKHAAPFYSVGHNERASRSHACYSLLEYYAFGQLQPVEQATTPSLLYAQLHTDGTKKRELVEQMAHNAGAEMSIRNKKTAEGHIATIIVSGGDIRTPIIRTGKGETEGAAIDSALGHILRNATFKTVTSRHEAIGQELLNPQDVLADELAKIGAHIEEHITERISPRTDMEWLSVFKVRFQDGTQKDFLGQGPNKDRAIRAAAVFALEALGTTRPSIPAHVASWASQPRDPSGGAGTRPGRP